MEARGQVNCYEPYKGHHGIKKVFYTINLAAGTTPFMKMFDGIECNSLCYRLRDPRIVSITHAWYRPSPTVFKRLDEGWHDHILNGGLHCAELPIAIISQMIDDPVTPDWEYERFQEFLLKMYGKRRRPLSPIEAGK